jgi:predicted nucleotidyltransferase
LRRQTSSSIRHKVAKEASSLLYTRQEKEYKQAKLRAAETFGARSLPSNKDIAFELDKLADETEGPERAKKLVQMRKDALWIMVILGDFHTRLIGSVWRGTANKNSDIDIEAFTSDQNKVLERITESGFAVSKAQWISVSKLHELESIFQVCVILPSKNEVELIIRSPEKKDKPDTCEIYRDNVKGLNIHQLRRILLTDPLRKFVPA